jgi:hypothetical protein
VERQRGLRGRIPEVGCGVEKICGRTGAPGKIPGLTGTFQENSKILEKWVRKKVTETTA